MNCLGCFQLPLSRPLCPFAFGFLSHTSDTQTLERGGWERDGPRDWEREELGGTVGEVHLDPSPLEQQLTREQDGKFWSYNSNGLKHLLSTARGKKNIQPFKDHEELLSTQ